MAAFPDTVVPIILDQIQAARRYTLNLLDMTPSELWPVRPEGCPTHIAWQVGHLAMAEFRLGVTYFREPTAEDLAVLTDEMVAPFRGGTSPGEAGEYPEAEELLALLGRVHEYVLAEVAKLDPALLEKPLRMKHRINQTGLDSLMWIARHESLHAGQIGLIRRLHGLGPAS
jgi:hypothetical protein